MSKPAARIVLSVVISLAVVAGIYTSVQGALAVEVNSARSHLVSGALTNLNHDRRTAAELEKLEKQTELFSPYGKGHGGGGCESRYQADPLD